MDTLIPISDDARPPEIAVAPLERSERPLLIALAILAALHIAGFVYVVATGLVRAPYSDMFDFLRAEFDLERTGDWLSYLASPHNHQHLVWVRLLTAIDVQVFHGGGAVFAVAACLSIFMGAAMLGLELWRGTSRRFVGAAGALLAVMLIVGTVNAIDCTQPINAVYPIAFGFAVLAIVLFEHAGERAGAGAAATAAVALLAGIGAALGSAAGVAVFPALMVSTVRNPANRRLLAPTLVIGLAALAVVVAALAGGGPGAAASAGAGHLIKMADYFVTYAGMPWSAIRVLSRAHLVLGLITIGLGAALLWQGSRREGAAGRLERIGLDLMLFALITAAMAALGRVDENAQVIVPFRYAVFMSAFQAGLVCRFAPALAERWDGARRYAVPALLVGAVALLFQQAVAGQTALRASATINRTIADFQAGIRRPEMRQLIHPDYNIALAVQAECRRRGIYQ